MVRERSGIQTESFYLIFFAMVIVKHLARKRLISVFKIKKT